MTDIRVENRLKEAPRHDGVYFLCIGTDRSTGDSLAPLVGTALERLGYKNVIGTLDEPAHAQNLAERAARIPKSAHVVAIDACLGRVSSVGKIIISNEPIRPGAGVGKELGKYGDTSISGVINVGGFMEYFVLQNTRLNLVMKMADRIVEEITQLFPIKTGEIPAVV